MRNPNLIALGVTGGIAAYKAAELCSMLRRNGFEVQVLMTDNATRFITPLTFRTLSQRPVVTSLWEVPEWRPEHVALADEAAFFVVAPATANFLAKYANGIADDALSTFAATFGGPVLLAPAMNADMWAHPATQANAETLKARGVRLLDPEVGELACGVRGTGRLPGPDALFSALQTLLLGGKSER